MFQRVVLDSENLARLVERLKQFAAEYRPPGRSRFVVFGNTLINDKQVNASPDLLPKILNLHGTVTRIELPFSATTIETATNARIFGLKGRRGEPLSAKILMRRASLGTVASRREGKSLFRDIHARRLAAPMLAAAGPLFAPRIVDYDRNHGRWLVEEMIDAAEAQPEDLARLAPAIDGAAVYAGSARLRGVFRHRGMRRWAELVASFDPDFPLPAEDALWPVAFCHSDLGGNILLTGDERLYVIDWELAKAFPVGAELASLYYANRDLRDILVEWLRRLDPEGRAVAPEVQIGMGMMRMISGIMRNPALRIAELTKMKGISHSEATALHEATKQRFRDHLAFLRSS